MSTSETDKQLNQEIADMYNKMRDPEEHDIKFAKKVLAEKTEEKKVRFGL